MSDIKKKVKAVKAKPEAKKPAPKPAAPSPVLPHPYSQAPVAPPVPAPKPANPATDFVVAALSGLDPDSNFGAARKKVDTSKMPGEVWWGTGDWDNCTVGAFIRYAATR